MSNRKINMILYISFFLSGISGLIYEVLWAKYLSLIFGSTIYAYTLVLATFMGGLALGSFFLGSAADKVKDKLKLYTWVQIGIASFCFFTPNFFHFSKNIYLIAARALTLHPLGIVAIKFIIGALIILPPTILMGGTLPILSKFIIRSLSMRGRTVARLYYINTFGAVMGTLLAGFYLIYHWGLEASIAIAASINLFAAILVFFPRRLSIITEFPAPQESSQEQIFPSKIINVALFGIFLSGFVAMLYEIVWIRLLSTILGSSTYSFSLMLAAFILGIAIGSFLISKFMPETQLCFLFFGLCEIFIGISLILALPFYEKLPLLFLRLSSIFSRSPRTFLLYSTTKFLLCFLVMLPPTIFLGATLPLVSKVASQKLKIIGKKIGSVFAFNTSGNILGALVAGLVLLPILGLKHTLEFGIVINISLGIIILFMDKTFGLKRKFALASICCLLLVGYKIMIPDWNKAYFSAQIFRGKWTERYFNRFSKSLENKKVLFYKDGRDATVSVIETGKYLSLFINGKADASTHNDMLTQILLAQLPLILKPQIKDVLVVGLGSGVTCGSALLHPINSLDLIEISPSVVEANKYFAKVNYNALENKKLHLYVEDAKTFLQRTDKKYDLIISEPSNPWMKGIGGLFSLEFFQDCKKRLRDDGLMVQWLQTYETSDEIYKIVLKTFSSVFPEITVWCTGINDTLLIGSNRKQVVDFYESEKRITNAAIKEDLARIRLHDLFTLLSLQLSSNSGAQDLIKFRRSVNSDYFPVLEYQAPLALYMNSSAEYTVSCLNERGIPLERNTLFIKKYLTEHKIDYDNLKNLFEYMDDNIPFNQNLLYALAKKWYKEYPQDPEAIAAYASYNIDSLENSIRALEKLIVQEKRTKYLENYVDLQLKKYNRLNSFLLPQAYTDVVEKLKMCINLSKDKKAKFCFLLGRIFCNNKDYRNAIIYYTQSEELIKHSKIDAEHLGFDQVGLLNDLSIVYLKIDNFERALAYAKGALCLDKENSLAKKVIETVERNKAAWTNTDCKKN